MTAESVRNGSHSIIEATASLMSANVMSNDQSIAFDATTAEWTLAKGVCGQLAGRAKGAWRGTSFALVYITYIIERVKVVGQFESSSPAISFRLQR